ncbi:hypothetical protein Q3G72_017862 [Acer saccharum]|nr:hypothetical protein Q3G72_017862 [Acer saccharum]
MAKKNNYYYYTLVGLMVTLLIMVEGTRAGLINLCNMNEDDLSTCKPAVTKPNPVDPPPPACCEVLKKADLSCLCSYKESPMLPALGIDPDLAMGLPPKCNLPLPQSCQGS